MYHDRQGSIKKSFSKLHRRETRTYILHTYTEETSGTHKNNEANTKIRQLKERRYPNNNPLCLFKHLTNLNDESLKGRVKEEVR